MLTWYFFVLLVFIPGIATVLGVSLGSDLYCVLRGSGSNDVADSLVSSLSLFKRFLLAQKPRLVTAAMFQTWIVFTDASCKLRTGLREQ